MVDILRGQDEDGEPSVYKDEAESLLSRLLSHRKSYNVSYVTKIFVRVV